MLGAQLLGKDGDTVRAQMEKIGTDLDRGIYPRVLTGGLLKPAGKRPDFPPAGKGVGDYVQQFSWSWQSAGPLERGGQSPGSFERGGWRAPSPAAPPLNVSLAEVYLGQVSDIEVAFPGVSTVACADGLWVRF